jgi:formylglycine-generating enzyme required for sulfatase activity
MKNLFKTIAFVLTGMLIINSCKDSDEDETDIGTVIDAQHIEMVKVEGDGYLSNYSIGKYEITQSQWELLRKTDHFYGIRVESENEKYVDYGELSMTTSPMWIDFLKERKEQEILTVKESNKPNSDKEFEIKEIEKKFDVAINQLSAFKGDNMPIVDICWIDAIRFCNALSRKENKEECYTIYFHYGISDIKDNNIVVGKDTINIIDSIKFNPNKKGYRLPTVEEWEYAAKGGKNSNGYTYSGSNVIDQVGWYGSNSSKNLHVVGAKQPNELGIYDMSGNVYEWTNDLFPDSKDNYIIRGGCWAHSESKCINVIPKAQADNRNINFWNYILGFRIAISE